MSSMRRLDFLKWSEIVLILFSTDRFAIRLPHFNNTSFSKLWDWQTNNYHGNHVHLCVLFLLG